MQQRFLLQILLLAQHVSGTTMPIIRSSGVLYGGCCLWYFVLWFSSCWSGVEMGVMCPVWRMLQLSLICGNKMPTRCNRDFFIADLIACSTCFGHHYAHHQELKSTIRWLLPVVFRAVVFSLLAWCGAEGYVSGLQDAAASCKPDTYSFDILYIIKWIYLIYEQNWTALYSFFA